MSPSRFHLRLAASLIKNGTSCSIDDIRLQSFDLPAILHERVGLLLERRSFGNDLCCDHDLNMKYIERSVLQIEILTDRASSIVYTDEGLMKNGEVSSTIMLVL